MLFVRWKRTKFVVHLDFLNRLKACPPASEALCGKRRAVMSTLPRSESRLEYQVVMILVLVI
jgi:hypothetical protein